MCFDKTGTLTEEGLSLVGVKPILIDLESETRKFHKLIKDPSKI